MSLISFQVSVVSLLGLNVLALRLLPFVKLIAGVENF